MITFKTKEPILTGWALSLMSDRFLLDDNFDTMLDVDALGQSGGSACGSYLTAIEVVDGSIRRQLVSMEGLDARGVNQWLDVLEKWPAGTGERQTHEQAL